MSAVCCVGSGLCDELITRPGGVLPDVCVCVCDLELKNLAT